MRVILQLRRLIIKSGLLRLNTDGGAGRGGGVLTSGGGSGRGVTAG
jgi:hypothetical protein